MRTKRRQWRIGSGHGNQDDRAARLAVRLREPPAQVKRNARGHPTAKSLLAGRIIAKTHNVATLGPLVPPPPERLHRHHEVAMSNGHHHRCHCEVQHPRRRIVVTGGPGAGKTAILELARKYFCRHVHVLPESASLLFGGGFPRGVTDPGKMAAQRAIFYVQRELERTIDDELEPAITLCDRGTLDGLAYWPHDEASFMAAIGTSQAEQFARYDVVLHLRTPTVGFDHSNPLRTENATEALAIDGRIEQAWAGHPRRIFIDASPDFLEKAMQTLQILRQALPPCCAVDMPKLRPLAATSGGEQSRQADALEPG
jgi:predicted ATPase